MEGADEAKQTEAKAAETSSVEAPAAMVNGTEDKKSAGEKKRKAAEGAGASSAAAAAVADKGDRPRRGKEKAEGFYKPSAQVARGLHEDEEPKEKKGHLIPKGKGEKLGSLMDPKAWKHIADENIKKFHRCLYNTDGTKTTRKPEISKWTGISGEKGTATQEDLERRLKTATVKQLQDICTIVGLTHSGTKDELSSELAEFLSCPKGDFAGKKLHSTGGKKSSKKSGKTSSKASSAKSKGGSGVKRPPGKFILFCNERRAAVKQEMEAEGVDAAPKEINKRLGEEWNDMDDDEKKPYKDKAEELLAAWKQSTGGGSSSKKGKKGEGDEDDEDEGEEDENEAVQGQGGAKRCRVDGLPESSGAAQPVFLPGLSLPTDVMRDVFLPLITPNDSTALCRTSEAVSSALEAGVAADIDSIIRHDGLTGVIGYRQVRQSTGVRRLVRRLRLIRLHYLMVAGGDWRGSVPLLRLAKSCGRVKQLPIELTKNDLQHVGSKAVIDSRPPSMRQYALFSHRLSQRMRLTRDAGGGDEMGGDEVTVYTDQTVPARYRDRFDPDDPVCEYGGVVYDGFRGMIIKSMAFGSSRLVSNRFYNGRPPSAECHRINVLLDQQPPLWDCRTIGYHLHTPRRFVILCGDEEGDDFLAFIEMTKDPYGTADMYLYTTEAPQSGVGGAGSPLTVSIAHNKMGDAITLLPDVDEASNTAVAAV